LNYYQQANQWDPSVPGLDKNLGQSAFRAGNYPEAISALSKALVQTPKLGPDTCQIDVQCGPRGLRGAGDSLFHNNGDGTFTDVSKAARVSDPTGHYGLGVVWADFNNTGKPDIYIANDSTPKYLHKI
jgi:tetratricopeptide (TPR) repeat protein